MLQAPSIRKEAPNVPLGQIEAILTQLSREAANQAATTGGMTARTSVMTLVAYARGKQQGERVRKAIEGLKGQHPSRGIILAADPDAETGSLSASVSLQCYTPSSATSQTCVEQIVINAQGSSSKHLASIVLPLLLTELPVFVWWTDGMPAGELRQNLVDLSDRVIVDSADFVHPTRDLADLAALMQNHVNRSAFSDFNWSRIRPWRELGAQFFDMPQMRPYLNGIQRVEIEYAVGTGQRANATQALLFAGWLASRLRWQALTTHHSAPDATEIGLKTRLGAPVAIEIVPHYGAPTSDWWAMSSAQWAIADMSAESNDDELQTRVGVGALMRVNFQTRSGGQAATFSVTRQSDMKNAVTEARIGNEDQPARYTPLLASSESSVLHDQLAIFGHEHIYEAALQAAASLVH
jgi:glucose-6-phosphate dehydrogenase assembly protein OpcA